MNKQKVLIVDDVALNIHVLSETLQDEYQLFFSTEATEVLSIAERVNPDIILLDVMMPKIDGYELCRRLKAQPLLREIPVIFITTLGSDENESKGLQIGAVDYITKPFNPEIVRLRIRNHLELKRNRDFLKNLSRIDGLTGIANRRAFDEALRREWSRAKRSDSPLSVLMIDIDYFKRYNDTMGHAAGDECLKTIALSIKKSLTRPSDLVSRNGGEEFVCILPDTDERGAIHTAKRIQEAIRGLGIPHPSSEVGEFVTVSIGCASTSQIDADSATLLEMADKALYRAKQLGRNRIEASTLDNAAPQVLPPTDYTKSKPDLGDLRQYYSLFIEENLHPVLIVSKQGIVLHSNRAAYKVFRDWFKEGDRCVHQSIYEALQKGDAKQAIEVSIEGRFYAFDVMELSGKDVIFLYGNDITDRKATEAEINRLKQVIDESINIVFITDYNGNIEYVNNTFEAITGYSRQEALGKNPRLLASGETSHANYKNLWDTIKAGKTWRGIFKNKKKNGDIYWANGFISPIKNEQGHITHFMAIQEDITHKMLADAKLHFLTNFDQTTGIINRSRFVEVLREAISSTEDQVKSGVLLQVNIDAFKLINDSYGHSIGDQFLKTFADFLRDYLWEIDAKKRPPREGIIGRLGGDEFALFLSDRDEHEGMLIAEELRRKIENHRFLNDMIRVTASIGITVYPDQGLTVSELLTKANVATTRAKELGQNRCYLYSDADSYLKTAPTSLEEKQMIISAMEEDRFVPYFQPILDIKQNKVHHYESLARLITPDGKVLLPSSFIFTAERYGLVSGIDKIITYKTMQIQAQLSSLGKAISFSMNLSGRHLGDESMLDYIKYALKDTGANPGYIVFELTETAAVRDFKRAAEFVRELKDIGCKFSLDDFGVGFTSFVHLIEMSVDFVKIDGSFVRNLPDREKDRILVRAMTDMAKGLGIRTIAEFVDREETLNILREMGVDYAQGYYIGRPSQHLLP